LNRPCGSASPTRPASTRRPPTHASRTPTRALPRRRGPSNDEGAADEARDGGVQESLTAGETDGNARGPIADVPDDAEVAALALDLGKMIEAAWQQVAVAANAALTTLYWQLGHRVRTEVLEGRRAESGAQIVAAVGRQLETRYGRGFGPSEARSGLAGGATSVSRAARVAAPAGWTAAIITRPLAAHAPACRSASNSFPRPPSRRAPSSASSDPAGATFTPLAALAMSAATAFGCDT